MIASRRSFLTGLGAALVTAPAIVRAASIMPVKVMPAEEIVVQWVGQMMCTNAYLHELLLSEDGMPVRYLGYDIFINGGFPCREAA